MPKILLMAKFHVEAINSLNSISTGKGPQTPENGQTYQGELNVHKTTITSLQVTLEQLREENKDQGKKLT